jgi:hypothetical protein
MRTDICAREDHDTQVDLLDALAAVGASPDGDAAPEVPFPTGLHRFHVGAQPLTVLVDTWLVDLEGPDELVRRVVEFMSAATRG